MDKNIKKWLWQHEDYPTFFYQKNELVELLSHLEYRVSKNTLGW